jgi:hypothetical protein
LAEISQERFRIEGDLGYAEIGVQESFDSLAQGRVAGALLCQVGGAFLWGSKRHGGGEDRFGAIGGFIHGWDSAVWLKNAPNA